MTSLVVNDLFNVKDKVVLVTGGSRGVGKMVSTCLLYFTSLQCRELMCFAQIATGFVRNGAKVRNIPATTAHEH